MRSKAKAYKQLGEAVQNVLCKKSGFIPDLRQTPKAEKVRRAQEAISRFGIDYDCRSIEMRFLASLIQFWKVNKRPPTHDEWTEHVGIKGNGRTSSIIKKLCISGKIIRIEDGEWHGKYVPVE